MILQQTLTLILLTFWTLVQPQNLNIIRTINSTITSIAREKRLLFPIYTNFQNTQTNTLYGTCTVQDGETFDFIVIGSGSAGSVIANRLSELPQWNILLLEVGEEASSFTDIPAIAPIFQFTNYNWNYVMEKQENLCQGMVDQRMSWPRGRALGGSTIINYMIHTRGNPSDYDKWAKLGNQGWSYQDVLPYFQKSEDYKVDIQDQGYHSKGGYLSVNDVPFRTGSAHVFVAAAQEAGHPFVDYNGQSQLGVSYVHATSRGGLRCSAEKAFLRPIRNRKNLKILTKARAVKILIDPVTKTANGVMYVKNGSYFKVKASKEVIVSAGALSSPQLLMLSGIGPKNHLQELGIPLLQDLPVGQKLYDHLGFLGLMFQFNQSIVVQQSQWDSFASVLEILLGGRGPLTSVGVEALAFVKTNVSQEQTTIPDVELLLVGASLATDKGAIFRKTFRITDAVYNTLYKPLEGKYVCQVLPMLLHPKSFGNLKLKSKNPFHWPKFFGNYLTDPGEEDVKTLIAGIREAQKIFKMPSMQRFGATLVTIPIPGCEKHIFNSDRYWECGLRSLATAGTHQVATCKMGPAGDPEAVVDNKLRVYGVKNLRVADTSVIPISIAAHTSGPAYMVGEKTADLVKEEWMGPHYDIDIRRSIKIPYT